MEDLQRKVFIVSDTGHDYSDAKRFGTPIAMTVGIVQKFALTQMKRTFERMFAGSSPEDFILQSGPSVMNAIACAAFVAKHKKLNLLIWKASRDGQDQYVCRKLVF